MTIQHDDIPGTLASQAENAAWLGKTYPALHSEAVKHLVRSYRSRGFTQRIKGYTATALDVLVAQIERHPDHFPIIKRVNVRPEKYIDADVDDHGRLMIEKDEYRLSACEGVTSVRAVGEPGNAPDTERGTYVRELLARKVIEGLNSKVDGLYKLHDINPGLVHSLTPEDVFFGYEAGAYHDAWLSIPKIAGDRRHSLANCYDCPNETLARMASEVADQFVRSVPPREDGEWATPKGYKGEKAPAGRMVITKEASNIVCMEERTRVSGTLLGIPAAFDWVASGPKTMTPDEIVYAITNVIDCYGQEKVECETWLLKAMAHQNAHPYERACRIIERKAAKGRADAGQKWDDDIANDKGTIDRGELKFNHGSIVYEARSQLADRVEITGSRINMRKYKVSEAALAGLIGQDIATIIDHPFLEGYVIKKAETFTSQSMGPRLVIYLHERPVELTRGAQ